MSGRRKFSELKNPILDDPVGQNAPRLLATKLRANIERSRSMNSVAVLVSRRISSPTHSASVSRQCR